jgi:hypothetical protein
MDDKTKQIQNTTDYLRLNAMKRDAMFHETRCSRLRSALDEKVSEPKRQELMDQLNNEMAQLQDIKVSIQKLTDKIQKQ